MLDDLANFCHSSVRACRRAKAAPVLRWGSSGGLNAHGAGFCSITSCCSGAVCLFLHLASHGKIHKICPGMPMPDLFDEPLAPRAESCPHKCGMTLLGAELHIQAKEKLHHQHCRYTRSTTFGRAYGRSHRCRW